MTETTNDTARSDQLPKLIDNGSDNNYGVWAPTCRHILLTWGLWKYIEGDASTPPVIPPFREASTQKAVCRDGIEREFDIPSNEEERQKKLKDAQPWMDANNLTLTKILSTVPEIHFHMVERQSYAKQAWEYLHSIYQPRNSLRATSIRGDIAAYRCAADMDVTQWLTDMQRLYGNLCRVDSHRMTDREFTVTILDNMPKTERWEVIVDNLREKVEESGEDSPTILTTILAKIRDVCWHRNRNNPQASAQVFTARAEAYSKRTQKRPRGDDPSASGGSGTKRQRNDKVCTNPHCGSVKGHSFEECVAYGGGSQGKYGYGWRGPWNIHLPPQQRTRANNVPPASHPRMGGNRAPAAHYVSHSPAPPQYPTLGAAPPPQYISATPIPPPIVAPVPTRADTLHDTFTTDDKSVINAVTIHETPSSIGNTHLDGDVIVASLPVLEQSMTRSDSCHHDSGANRHVFHDKTAFETYEAIHPVAVSGFGHNVSAIAIGRGTVRLEGRYGHRTTSVCLTNVLHIPAARSNLISGPQLDKAGVTAVLGNGLATLSIRGNNIIGGALYNDMYRLNLTIIRPVVQISQGPPALISRIGPIAAAASSDQAGFYTA
jgi:gag-polypeptide of LTR copia-type